MFEDLLVARSEEQELVSKDRIHLISLNEQALREGAEFAF